MPREPLLLAAAMLAVFATRIGYLPQTLEDLDSVNFDLGVHRFYPFEHQPHPPGYPVFIAIAKLVHPLFETHAAGLAFPSVLFSALVVLPFYMLSRRLVGRPQAALACVLLVFNPVFWLNSVRPMSDVTGFAAVLTAQCVLILALLSAGVPGERSRLMWSTGVVLAGLAVGVRLQTAVLVGPVLALGVLQERRFRLPAIALFPVTCVSWLVPTVLASGGWRRFMTRQMQVLEDAASVEPLLAQPTWERIRSGAVDTFVAPWGPTSLAVVVWIAAAAGAIVMWRRQPRSLGLLLLLFGPYAVYHYLLQAPDLRYAIPILPLVALPASAAAVHLARRRPLGVAAIAGIFLIAATGNTRPALEAYAREPTPPASAVRYLRELAEAEQGLVVAGDHVFRRYLSELVPMAQVIRTEPRQEWRALNRFWVADGRRPIWFLREPNRSMVRQLADPSAQTHLASWQWPDPVTRLLKGARPTHVELVRLDPPRWFAESGFFLTPEAGAPDPVSREAHLLFVRSGPGAHDVIVSGTALSGAAVTVVVGREPQGEWQVDNYFSVPVVAPSDATGGYVPVRLDASAPLLLTDVSLVADSRDRLRPVSGFHAPEQDEEAREFRWMGPRATAVVSRSGASLTVTLRGRVPLEHYRQPLALNVKAEGMPEREHLLTGPEFTVELDLAGGESRTTTVSFAVSQSFVPDEREGNGDRRSLALRIYDLETNVSSRGSASGSRRSLPAEASPPKTERPR